MSKPSNMEERLEALRLLEASYAADDAVESAPKEMPEAEYGVLAAAARSAQQAYDDYPLAALIQGYGAKVAFCGVSGAPLIEDDEILEDAHTGEMFLRSALGLPPRAEEEEGEELMSDMAGAA